MSDPVRDVNWLPICEIARLWAEETGKSAIALERALIEWFADCWFEVDTREESAGWVDPALDDFHEAEGVDNNTLMPRSYFDLFCQLGDYQKPAFWFGGTEVEGPSFPGKPSIMKAIHQELIKRAEAQNLEVTLADQARELIRWADQVFPNVQTPKAKSMENGIRKLYWELRGTPQN